MCTVTYLPLSDSDFILTSSRDVPYHRKRAAFPKKYEEDGVALWYPKDGKAGGTWIGTSSKNRLICLLNGGFEYHTSRANYRMSRGLIVKALLKMDVIETGLNEIDLTAIEPFTLVIIDWNTSLRPYEFVWDGTEKHITELSQKPWIWSSSTLYDDKVKKMRMDWFMDWQKNNESSQKSILEFHHTAGIGDPNIDVFMDRGMGGTVSIASIYKKQNDMNWYYEDVKESNVQPLSLNYKCQK